jgi:hypothetical protein
MRTGVCVRCGAVGPVEHDHPDGRVNDVPIVPKSVEPLCQPCHHLKGVMDRAGGVEGGAPTLRLLLARRAAWASFLASHGHAVLVPAHVLADLASILASIARQIPERLRWSADE